MAHAQRRAPATVSRLCFSSIWRKQRIHCCEAKQRAPVVMERQREVKDKPQVLFTATLMRAAAVGGLSAGCCHFCCWTSRFVPLGCRNQPADVRSIGSSLSKHPPAPTLFLKLYFALPHSQVKCLVIIILKLYFCLPDVGFLFSCPGQFGKCCVTAAVMSLTYLLFFFLFFCMMN